MLREGLARLRADTTHRFRTLFMSHWAESLHLLGKVERPVLSGSFVSATITQTDACQVRARETEREGARAVAPAPHTHAEREREQLRPRHIPKP